MEEEKLKNLNKKYKRPEKCPQLSASKVNSEVWNENLLTVNRMTDISLQERMLEKWKHVSNILIQRYHKPEK